MIDKTVEVQRKIDGYRERYSPMQILAFIESRASAIEANHPDAAKEATDIFCFANALFDLLNKKTNNNDGHTQQTQSSTK